MQFQLLFGQDTMVLSLAAVHTSIFNTTRQAFFLIKSAYGAFFASCISFYQQTFLVTSFLLLLHLSVQDLTLEIHSFKLLQYTCECSN